MTGHATGRSEDAGGSMHAADIFRAGVFTYQDDRFAFMGTIHRLIGGVGDLSGGGTGRGRQTDCQDIAFSICIKGRQQQLIEVVGGHPQQRLLLGNTALHHHLHGDRHCRPAGALPGPSL